MFRETLYTIDRKRKQKEQHKFDTFLPILLSF